MTVVEDIGSLKEWLTQSPAPLALVPTMGALHDGHLSLIRAARESVGPEGKVAVSIFVNPIQFDRAHDLSTYPRPLENDLALCKTVGADLVFTPTKESLYLRDHSVLVTESRLARYLCGASRPGHFDGVLTIVLKLFNLFQPRLAVFGEKDFQQLALIRRMIRDLNLPVEIIAHPTVREPDGLALSSRNQKLAGAHRADAGRIARALSAARDLSVSGESRPSVYLDCARTHLLEGAPTGFAIAYLEIVDPETLQPVATISGRAILATACMYGEVRLIDHLQIQV